MISPPGIAVTHFIPWLGWAVGRRNDLTSESLPHATTLVAALPPMCTQIDRQIGTKMGEHVTGQ